MDNTSKGHTSVGLALQVHAYCYASIGLLYVIIAPNGLGRHDKTSICAGVRVYMSHYC